MQTEDSRPHPQKDDVTPAQVCATVEPVPPRAFRRHQASLTLDSGRACLLLSRHYQIMGRTLESKQQVVAQLRQLLDEAELALVLDYKGLSVKEMGNLRTRLREHSSTCKVAKNSLMRQAIGTDPTWTGLDPLLTGTNAFVLVKDDVGGAVKAIQAFQQETKKSDIKGGLLEGRLLSDEDLKAVGNLPSREALMAQIAGSLNGLATKVAVAIKEVPAGLARALQQHADADADGDEVSSPPAG